MNLLIRSMDITLRISMVVWASLVEEPIHEIPADLRKTCWAYRIASSIIFVCWGLTGSNTIHRIWRWKIMMEVLHWKFMTWIDEFMWCIHEYFWHFYSSTVDFPPQISSIKKRTNFQFHLKKDYRQSRKIYLRKSRENRLRKPQKTMKAENSLNVFLHP